MVSDASLALLAKSELGCLGTQYSSQNAVSGKNTLLATHSLLTEYPRGAPFKRLDMLNLVYYITLTKKMSIIFERYKEQQI